MEFPGGSACQGSGVVTAVVQVTIVAGVRSLAQKLPPRIPSPGTFGPNSGQKYIHITNNSNNKTGAPLRMEARTFKYLRQGNRRYHSSGLACNIQTQSWEPLAVATTALRTSQEAGASIS